VVRAAGDNRRPLLLARGDWDGAEDAILVIWARRDSKYQRLAWAVAFYTTQRRRRVSIVNRAFELGVTYYDTARIYGDSEIKMGLALEDKRSSVIISTKTGQ